MKINIYGGSGVGKTSLSQNLANELGWPYIDSDDYYWQETPIPYTEKIPKALRNARIQSDFSQHEDVILSGCMMSWGNFWYDAFDIGFLLIVEPGIRMDRLRQREKLRYGQLLISNPKIRQNSEEFLRWAARYDDPKAAQTNITLHRQWKEWVHYPVVELNGNESFDRLIKQIKTYLGI